MKKANGGEYKSPELSIVRLVRDVITTSGSTAIDTWANDKSWTWWEEEKY